MSFGTFPAASKMLLQREKDKAYSLHRQRMYNVKSQIDNSPPRQHAHLLLRLKQLQTEEEKKAKIDKENKLLLRKMTQIMLSREHRKKRTRNQPDMKASLNQEYRDRIRERINAENIQIAQRIQKTRPIYDTGKWLVAKHVGKDVEISKTDSETDAADQKENDYKHKQKLMDMWSKTTKDFQSPRAQRDDDYDYESDFESDDERKKGDKLPPISKRGTNRGSETERSREGKQEHQSPERELYMYYGLKKPRDYHSHEEGDDDHHRQGNKGQNRVGDDDNNDVRQLFKVAKELIPPHEAIIKCLAKKNSKQRMAIADDFQEEYDLDMKSELKKGLGHEWFTLINALLKKPGTDDDAEKAELTKGLDVSNAVSLTKKLTTLNNQEMADLKEQYMKENSNSLEAEISKRHKDPIERFLLTLAKGGNNENDEVDEKAAEKDAQDLMEFGEGRWTSTNGKFLQLLETQSPSHVRSVLAHYKTKNKGKTVTVAIEEECPRAYADVLNAYINSSEESASQELDTLHKDLDARNPTFVEMVVAKSENGMGGTKKAYKARYGSDLVSDFQSKNDHTTTSVLTALINKKPTKKGKNGSKKGKSDHEGSKKTPSKHSDDTNKEGKATGRRASDAKQKDNNNNSNKQQDSKTANAADTTRKQQGATHKNNDDKAKQQQQQQHQKETKEKDEKSEGGKKDTNDDVKKLYDAMDGLGTNEDVIIDIIVNKSNAERQKLRKAYKERYKKDLVDELKSELSGDFEEVILALILTPLQYDAYCLHESMSGAGTDETILIGILCSKKQAELNDIKKQYKKDYNSDLESDIRGDTSGDMEDLLVKIVRGERDQSKDVDKAKAEQDAKVLHEDPSSKALKDILINNNRSQLKATEDAYKKMFNEEMTDAIERAASGDSEDAFVAIVKANRDLVLFYTNRIHSALKGLGTNDTQLIRILVARSEIDLPAIKVKYKELHGNTLRQDVEDDTSGDYKKTLLKIIDGC